VSVHLTFERAPTPPPDDEPVPIGQRDYRAVETGEAASPALLAAGSQVIDPGAGIRCVDLWRVAGSARTGTAGCIRFTAAGDWLFGTARVDEAGAGGAGGLTAATALAYGDIFALLDREHGMALARAWNFFAAINEASSEASAEREEAQAAVERYRLFNLGRQRAFVAARRDAFDGAPAACALGTERGPLTIHFLATRRPVRPVENPRQISAYRYPPAYGPRSPTFSRAVRVDLGSGTEALFVSGTASIVGHETRHIGDIRRQTEESLANVSAVVGAAAAAGGARHREEALDYTIYVRDRRDLDAVRETFAAHFGGDRSAVERAIYLRADICRPDLLVEIEAHGSARIEGGR
jgi:enamine deaminase RidA (YjgF/YER057c/UK114 family)